MAWPHLLVDIPESQERCYWQKKNAFLDQYGKLLRFVKNTNSVKRSWPKLTASKLTLERVQRQLCALLTPLRPPALCSTHRRPSKSFEMPFVLTFPYPGKRRSHRRAERSGAAGSCGLTRARIPSRRPLEDREAPATGPQRRARKRA